MRYLKNIRDRIKQRFVIKKFCIDNLIDKYTINKDMSIDVDNDVRLKGRLKGTTYGYKNLPVKFNKVSGSFDCSGQGLLSLEGCPYHVGGSFFCRNNDLKTLKGSPYHVGGSFECTNNKLISLEGCPQYIGLSFLCSSNYLENLIGSPDQINGSFICRNNDLKTLKGSPKYIERDIDVSHNRLKDLKYSPDFIGGSYDCTENKLYSIEGCPQNYLLNQKNKTFSSLHLNNNPIYSIVSLFDSGSNLNKFISSLDYHYIRGFDPKDNKGIIDRERLREALEEFNKPIPVNKPLNFYINITRGRDIYVENMNYFFDCYKYSS